MHVIKLFFSDKMSSDEVNFNLIRERKQISNLTRKRNVVIKFVAET
jgi:hypothetical protein